MDFNKISMYTTLEGLDILFARLVMEDIEFIETQDPRDVEEVMQDSMYWDYIDDDTLELAKKPCVRVYLDETSKGKEQYEAVMRVLEDAKKEGIPVEVEYEGMKEEDWANNWKQYFKPLKVGEKIIIKPSWEELPDAEGRTVLEIDPSVSFGTGGHATTRLCMEGLEKAVFKGCELLDLGCGSGILFVGGMLLGAGHAVAVDIDENAINTSRDNAARNNITNYELYCGNVLGDEALCEKIGYGKYDVIAANIIADVIIAMSGLFTKFLKKGGKLITSGIITERKDEVLTALMEAGFVIENISIEGDWTAISCGF
ncbi:MAG: 50S ribosomal protein L11 methyltransferase [Christensenellaceae bacterium]|nr:50S ribosomal protein L11 methyltransferase [Christensenellaceae bacterium]